MSPKQVILGFNEIVIDCNDSVITFNYPKCKPSCVINAISPEFTVIIDYTRHKLNKTYKIENHFKGMIIILVSSLGANGK